MELRHYINFIKNARANYKLNNRGRVTQLHHSPPVIRIDSYEVFLLPAFSLGTNYLPIEGILRVNVEEMKDTRKECSELELI